MSYTKRWLMEVEEQERARLEEQCIRERDIIETRKKIGNLLSRLDYDTLIRIENDIEYERSTRPEELFF